MTTILSIGSKCFVRGAKRSGLVTSAAKGAAGEVALIKGIIKKEASAFRTKKRNLNLNL